MSTDIVLRQPGTDGLDLITLGKTLASSGYFQDARDAAQAVVKVLAGQEMGIGPVASMTGIYIVKGRVTLSANLMAAQIKRSGRYNYQVARLEADGCEIVFFESGREIGRSSFTKEDAIAAGLWNSSDPWKKTPRNMLYARAMSNGAKWYTPDVFSGPVYTPDELTASDVEMMPAPQPARPALPAAPPADTITGEVVEAQHEMPTAHGSVSGVNMRYNANGEGWLTFAVEGAGPGRNGIAITAKITEELKDLAYLEDGDSVTVTYSPVVNRGKGINMLRTIEGTKSADGMTDWEERAAAANVEGATFAPVTEEAAPAAA